MTCKRCAVAYKPMKPKVHRYGDFLRKSCDCGISMVYNSKVKVIATKRGYVKLEIPE